MPRVKVIPPGSETHGGCRVTGLWLTAEGKGVEGARLWLKPEHGGVWHGVVYTPNQVWVTPDEAGRWSVTLPPSSVVGDYTVVFDALRFTMRVPDDRTDVTFEEVARVAEQHKSEGGI